MNFNIICSLRNLLFSIICLFSVLSCNRKESNIVLSRDIEGFTAFPFEKSLTFTKVFEYDKGRISRLFIKDSSLIIFNHSVGCKYFLYNYSLDEKNLSKGYLKKGRGPYEALGGFHCGIKNDILWVNDVTLKRVTMLPLSKFLENTDGINYRSYDLTDFYASIDFIDSLKFIGNGFRGSTSKVITYDVVENTKIKEIGNFYHIPKNLEVDALMDAYSGYLWAKPSNEKAVLAYFLTDVIEVFNFDDYSCCSLQGPHFFDVEFNVATNRYGQNYAGESKKMRNAFVGGCVTNQFIYLVFSGQLESERSSSQPKVESIFVYDWDGNPIQKLKINNQIGAIAVSKDDKEIYAYDVETGNIIKSHLSIN